MIDFPIPSVRYKQLLLTCNYKNCYFFIIEVFSPKLVHLSPLLCELEQMGAGNSCPSKYKSIFVNLYIDLLFYTECGCKLSRFSGVSAICVLDDIRSCS